MITRIFPGSYESLAEIANFVRVEAKQTGLSFKEIFELETAVDEAVSNIIEHAYGGEGRGEISCTCAKLEEGIKITLEDNGLPFDPSSVPAPNLGFQIRNRNNHGLGFYMIRQLVDDIQVEYTGQKNILNMVKRKKE